MDQELDRRSILTGMAALGAAAAYGAQSMLPAPARASLSTGDVDDLDRISEYINQIKTLQGNFVQVASNGVRDGGKFYFRRPGRLRFEYEQPNPILIVSDGTWLAVTDRELKTVDRLPLSSHPLKVLLRKNVNLAAEDKVVAVHRVPGSVSVIARDDEGMLQGELEMVFADPAIELLQWRIVDAQGFAITIALRDIVRDDKIDSKLFRIDDEENPFRDQRQ